MVALRFELKRFCSRAHSDNQSTSTNRKQRYLGIILNFNLN